MTKQHVATNIRSRIISSFEEFFRSSAASGVIILVCTAIAMIWVNSPLSSTYHSLLHAPVNIQFFSLHLNFSLEHFINDGLMVIFFLVVGLEIKRELFVGELSSVRKALLPIIAAIAGMIGPGAIYAILNWGTPAVRGWGVPVATDIAFALGVLALLGPRIPIGLKVFLAALAIVDDLLAVLVIAIFYTSTIQISMLVGAAITLALLFIGNRIRISKLWFYIVGGVVLWVFVLFSGIHATIAGVLLAMVVPVRSSIDRVSFFTQARNIVDRIIKKVSSEEDEGEQADAISALERMCEQVQSPLTRIEHGLSKVISFGIMPVFALANAGVHIKAEVVGSLFSPVGLGVALGLFVGKQVGVFSAVWMSVKLGIAQLPNNTNMRQLYGVAALCGIGFTMALFVAHLAFTSEQDLDIAKFSIIVGSILSAIVGSIILKTTTKAPAKI